MPKTYHRSITRTTEETREQLCFDHFINFMTVRKVCQRYRLANKTVRDIIERFRRTNSVEYRPRGGCRNIKIKDEHYTFLRNIIDKRRRREHFDARATQAEAYCQVFLRLLFCQLHYVINLAKAP